MWTKFFSLNKLGERPILFAASKNKEKPWKTLNKHESPWKTYKDSNNKKTYKNTENFEKPNRQIIDTQ